MAVSSTATDYSGLGTGASATYGTGIYANASDQIKVYANGVRQTLGVNYSLNGIGAGTGVNVVGSFANGATVYIERVTPITQLVDTQNNETILEDVLDAEFDKLTMIAQELGGISARALLVPKGESGLAVPAQAARLNRFLAFDATGALVVSTGTGNDTALRSDLAATTGATLMSWLSSRASAVVRSIADVFADHVSVMDFIPLAERVKIRLRTSTADLAAYFSAAAACGTEVLVPDGLYNVSSFTMASAGAAFVGQGAGTVVRATNPALNMITLAADDIRLERMRLEGVATSAIDATFAVFSAAAAPAKRAKLVDLSVSGPDAARGFNNFAKFDTGCDYPEVRGCYVERLWGTDSGFGYGVLCGGVIAPKVLGNVFIGSASRGRHAIYLSAGTSHGRALYNYVSGFQWEGITSYSTDAQPTAVDNIIAFNTLVGCASSGGFSNSSISLFTNTQECTVAFNRIKNSGGCGIKSDGTGSVNHKHNRIIGNQVLESGYIGIDIASLQGFDLVLNHVRESSQVAVGTYANIRLLSDGVTATSAGLVALNRSHGTAFARSAFQCNATVPVPSDIKCVGNRFDVCNLTDVELTSAIVQIDGRIRAAIGAFDPPSIANGASYSTSVSVPGSEVGDVVTLAHAVANFDGCAYQGGVTANGTVGVTILNNSGGAKDLPAATLSVDVWKRKP